jgi:cytochrome d ubiquinol oxidase subunit II
MLILVIIILGLSFILYTLLGGADFGAGIIETFAGRKGERAVSRAIAPVWEANHVWLILAVVILFTAFPLVYSSLSLVLHIPLMMVLLGIILRGTAFTFRHYDVVNDRSHLYYSAFFKISSFLTPIFLGVTLGAMILGRITFDLSQGFFTVFIEPWLNAFSFVMGAFCTALFAYIAAVFLVTESTTHIESARYIRLMRRALIVTILSGILVFVTASLEGHDLTAEFFNSPLSITCLLFAAVLTAAILYLIGKGNRLMIRIVTGLQVTAVVVGWFAIQYPVMITVKNGEHLTFFNTRAPDATLEQLLIALAVGLLLIIPGFFYLFRVFKVKEGQ